MPYQPGCRLPGECRSDHVSSCCEPVAFLIASMVVPLGWLSSAMTVACLEFARSVVSGAGVVRGVFGAARLRARRLELSKSVVSERLRVSEGPLLRER